MHNLKASFAIVAVALTGACAPAAVPISAADIDVERAAVDSVLTELHRTAAAGDWASYFGLYSPDAVFFGTDAAERWNIGEFRGYAAGSSGWAYDKTERNVFVSADGNTAWFDERLNNANYGETRGTGVLVKDETGWKISQYNLTIPIPNELATEFAERILAVKKGPGAQAPD